MRTHPALGEAFGHAADVSPGSVALVAAASAGLTFLDNGQPLAPCRIYLMLRVPPFTMTARLRMVACQRETGTVQPRHGAHHTLLLPGLAHPFSLAKHGMRTTPPAGLAERPVP